MSQQRQRVALVDDDPNAANALGVLLEDAGFEPVVVNAPLESVDSASARIEAVAGAAVCDHRLSPRGLAYFTGAELVARLYTDRFPAVLISQYLKIDQDVSIRRHRERIPVLLARTEADPERLAGSIGVCRDELAGRPLPQRRPWRTLVRVVAKDVEGEEDVLDAIIPGWRTDEAVRFPAVLLGKLRQQLPEGRSTKLGLRFFAQVNIGAEDARDLFLAGFEPAPEPRDDDNLA